MKTELLLKFNQVFSEAVLPDLGHRVWIFCGLQHRGQAHSQQSFDGIVGSLAQPIDDLADFAVAPANVTLRCIMHLLYVGKRIYSVGRERP